MSSYTPQQFVDKWERTALKERASYVEHFNDVCRLMDHPTPADKEPAIAIREKPEQKNGENNVKSESTLHRN